MISCTYSMLDANKLDEEVVQDGFQGLIGRVISFMSVVQLLRSSTA